MKRINNRQWIVNTQRFFELYISVYLLVFLYCIQSRKRTKMSVITSLCYIRSCKSFILPLMPAQCNNSILFVLRKLRKILWLEREGLAERWENQNENSGIECRQHENIGTLWWLLCILKTFSLKHQLDVFKRDFDTQKGEYATRTFHCIYSRIRRNVHLFQFSQLFWKLSQYSALTFNCEARDKKLTSFSAFSIFLFI